MEHGEQRRHDGAAFDNDIDEVKHGAVYSPVKKFNL